MPCKQGFDNATARPVHLSWEECEVLYPRLIKCLQNALILSTGEAACCIRDYLDGHNFSCEAISHNGRTPREAIVNAIRGTNRNWTRGGYDWNKTDANGRKGTFERKLHERTAEHTAIVQKVREAVRAIASGKEDIIHLTLEAEVVA